MAGQYAKSPILEVVCEFRFLKSDKWDITIPGLLYEKLKDFFPKKQPVLLHEIEVIRGPEGLKQQLAASERVRFLSEDEKSLVQVGPHLLTINKLRPYTSWDDFRFLIQSALNAYREIADVKGFERIGLRYINRIEFEDGPVRLENYFEFRPHLGEKLPHDFESFIMGVIFDYEGGRDKCRVQFTKEMTPPPACNYILDIDYFLAQPNLISPDQAMEWVDQAHNHIKEIFEGCITDRLKDCWR
jgi:uncharacterized protein (TIGR04255 family)